MTKGGSGQERGLPGAAGRLATADSRDAPRVWHGEGDAFRGPKRTVTYEDFRARVAGLASTLADRGFQSGDAVVFVGSTARAFAEAAFSAWEAGGHVIPVDASWPRSRVRQVLAVAKAMWVVLESADLLDTAADVEIAPATYAMDQNAWLTAAGGRPKRDASQDLGLAYTMFTSGSTGSPKGVRVDRYSLVNYLTWRTRTLPLQAGTKSLALAPVGLDVTMREVIWPVTFGGIVAQIPSADRNDPSVVVSTMRAQDTQILHVLPRFLDLLLDEPGFSSLTSLRLIHASAEPLPMATVRRFFAETTGVSLHHSYGPTEATVSATFLDCAEVLPGTEGNVPLGLPIDNTEIAVLRTDLTDVSIGETGEIFIAGAGLARGYLDDDAATSRAFVQLPGPRGRAYRTGDLGVTTEDGELRFAGRVDNVVKVRGFRVEVEEVESVLRDTAAVSDCVVVGNGEGLVAAVVPVPGLRPTLPDLRTAVLESKPAHMAPTRILLMDSVPLTPAGKVDRRAVADNVRRVEPVNEEPDRTVRRSLVAEQEMSLEAASVVADVLQVMRDVLQDPRLEPDDDFFAVGGESLQAMRIVGRLRKSYSGARVRLLFENPSAELFAKALASLGAQQARS